MRKHSTAPEYVKEANRHVQNALNRFRRSAEAAPIRQRTAAEAKATGLGKADQRGYVEGALRVASGIR